MVHSQHLQSQNIRKKCEFEKHFVVDISRTRACRAHLFRAAGLRDLFFLENGIHSLAFM